MIADFMTPRGRRDFTYPASLLAEIEREFGPYRLHLSQTYAGGGANGVLDELFDELEYKAKVGEYLMTRYEWDAFFQYFWGTDRIQHELWHIIDETHPRYRSEEARIYRNRIHEYFNRVDEIIGRLIALAGSDRMVWVVSDHGFGPAHKYCSLNVWLLQEGFLKLKRNALTRIKKAMFSLGLTPELAFKVIKKLPLAGLRPSRGASNQPSTSKLLGTFFLSFNDVDWDRTVAFSKGNYGQIYVNLKGREPGGIVEERDYDAVCGKIVERLKALKDPLTGEGWAEQVLRREELYAGPRVADAPDIAFLPRDMRYLPLGNADFTSNKFIVDAFGISGCHRMNGVMIAEGGAVESGLRIETAHIVDVAPTLLYLMGQSLPDDMDGRVLTEVISNAYLTANSIRIASKSEGDRSEKVEFSPEENEEIIESLKNLGYIG
jgi:predicted AlkP superfamily phosphohydrolase/phosphomutase